MRRVRWSRRALDQLKRAISYIADHSPAAARVQHDLILETGEKLGRRPIGRPGQIANTYEKRVIGTRYRLVYRIDQSPDGILKILRVWHDAQDWTADPLDDL